MNDVFDQGLAVVAVIAVVAAARRTFPKIDGILVLFAALVAGVGLTFLYPALPTLQATILRGVLWGLGGSGFMKLAKVVGGDDSNPVGTAPKAGMVLLCCLALGGATGCGLLHSASPEIGPGIVKAMQWEEDAQAKLEQVQAVVSSLVTDPKVRANIQEKLDAVRTAIETARAATRGVKDMADADIAGAFSDFRTAWNLLVPLLKTIGLVSADGTRFSAAGPGAYHPPALPVPLAMALGGK
jgi:hypothetical protein